MSTETVQIDWKEFNTSKRWVKRLKRKNDDKEIPKQTLRAMNAWFPGFLSFHNMTPDELIEEALVDPENAENRLDEYYNKRKNEIDRNSCITGIYGVIKGFYRHNKVNVLEVSTPSFSERQVVKTDSNYSLFKIVQVSKDDKKIRKLMLNRQLLREFYSHLSNTYQCIFLCVLSTGLDSEDLLKTTVGDIRAQFNQERIHFSGNRNKTYSMFLSFATKEASDRIKELVKTQRANAEDDEAVFVTSEYARKCKFAQLYNKKWTRADELPAATKLSANDISDAFRTAQKNMGIKLQKGKQSPLRPKRFKKVFRTACSSAGLDQDITDKLLGHKLGGKQSKTYQEEASVLLEFYFEMVEPKISLFFDEEAEIEDKNEMKLEIINMKQKGEVKSKKIDNLEKMVLELQEKRSIKPDEATKQLILKILDERKISNNS